MPQTKPTTTPAKSAARRQRQRKPLTVVAVHDRETPNKERFQVGGDDKMGSLYLSKAQFKALGSPAQISVTIAAG